MLPDDLIANGVEHTRWLHAADSSTHTALSKRVFLRRVLCGMAARCTGDPATSVGITRDRDRTLIGHLPVGSPDREQALMR